MKKTDFELVKDAEDLPSFLSNLRLANHLAWDVVFLAIVSYYKTYERITRLGAFASIKYSIDKQRNY